MRARIGALAGMAEDWAAAVRRWRELCAPLRSGGAPDAVEEYTIFQTLVGAWPIEPERLCAYMAKAMREAKRNTSWVEPDGDWEAARARLLPRALRARRRSAPAFEPFAERVAAAGELHALRQTALKLTVPGVPDIYQGDELVALSLVDPDNRRPVDWARRRALLAELRDGAAPDAPDARKLWLIRALLALRARRPGGVRRRLHAARRRRRRGRVPARRRRRGRAADPRRGALDARAAAGRLAPGRSTRSCSREPGSRSSNAAPDGMPRSGRAAPGPYSRASPPPCARTTAPAATAPSTTA